MKFLVTGAAGFIGKRVVAQLLEKKLPVIATTINIEEEKDNFFKYINSKNISKKRLNVFGTTISYCLTRFYNDSYSAMTLELIKQDKNLF